MVSNMKKYILTIMTLVFINGCSTIPDPSACDKNQNVSDLNGNPSPYINVDYVVPCDKPRPINI